MLALAGREKNSTFANANNCNLMSFFLIIASNGFITGQLQLADASAFVSNPGNVAGGAFFSQSQVTTAINTVNSLSSSLGAETGTPLIITGGSGGIPQPFSASSGTLDGSGNEVFTVAANALHNNSTGITINGTASQFVVININNGTSNESLNGPILLSGGITSDHVLFNFTGTSGHLGSGSTNGSVENGNFLAPNMLVNLDNVVIDGRLFGGQRGADFSIVSGFMLNQPVSPRSVGGAPEPSSIVLIGIGGIACLAGYSWRNRQQIAADR